MQWTFTAFQGPRRLASGPAGEVALVVKRMASRPDEPIIIFEDATGRSIDFDLRGGDREVLARLAKLVPPRSRRLHHQASRAAAAGRSSAWSRAR